MWSVLSFPGLESSRGQGKGRPLQSLMQSGSHRVDREGPWDPQRMELGQRVPQRAMLGSAAHYSAFAGRGEEPQTTTSKKSSLSVFTEIHMAIQKLRMDFVLGFHSILCQRTREQVSDTRLSFTGLVDSVADRILGHTNSGSLSFMVFFSFYCDHKPDRGQGGERGM